MAFSIKNKSFAFFCLIALLCSCRKERVGAVITEVDSPTSFQLSCVKFVGNNGFACGGSQFSKSEIIRTLDGGATWDVLTIPPNTDQKQLYSIDVLANGRLQAVGYGGVTFSSDNFGTDVRFQQEPRYAHWRGVSFRNNNEAVICGRDGIETGLITYTNKTDNWQFPWNSDVHSFGMYHITFADSLTGYIAGFGAIYKTIDGGNSWSFTTAKNDYFTATEWFSATEGVAIGWEGSILRTEDGGENWEIIRNANKVAQKKIYLKSLAQNSAFELVAVGEKGCMLYSSDHGRNWKSFAEYSDTNLESVSFQDNNTFFAVGEGGRIFKVEL